MSTRPDSRITKTAGAAAFLAAQLSVFPLLAGQQTAQPGAAADLKFEVASIKQSVDQKPPAILRNRGRLVWQHATLARMLVVAYNTSVFVEPIGGPKWIRSIGFDVEAKPGRPATWDEMRLMLRALLADRFKVVAHVEDTPTDVYFLEVAKGGPKLQETDSPKAGVIRWLPFYGRGATIEQLATWLSVAFLWRPVLDKTGLKGFYDFTFDRGPETGAAASAIPVGEAGGNGIQAPERNSHEDLVNVILTGIEPQLGLKLTEHKAPMPVVVVDSAEMPSEN